MAIKVGRCLLNHLLKHRGMTQRDLADKLEMSESQLSQYATNRRGMTLETARAIALALGCYIDDLYEWIETPKKSRH